MNYTGNCYVIAEDPCLVLFNILGKYLGHVDVLSINEEDKKLLYRIAITIEKI